jgi:hypothetical protein
VNKGIRNFNWYKTVVSQYSPMGDIYDIGAEERDLSSNVVDFDELEGQDIPIISLNDIDQYMVDSIEERGENLSEFEEILDEVEYEEAPPIEVTDDDMPEFRSIDEALQWAIENDEVMRINYVTKRGTDIVRIVEPHLLFFAGTGNLIAVTYDRSIRGIRAFIVNNILNYIFTGKEFKKRMRIL